MLIVFDLDFTLWDCGGTWCDHTNPPYFRQNGIIRDDDDRKIRLYDDTISILQRLHQRQIPLAIASRTGTPAWANELMELFDIRKFFQYLEIYPGSKINHFYSLRARTSIPYRDMIFFDDECRNIEEVARIGVRSVFVENGISGELVEAHLNRCL
jgi:magnesium-dependent phosphatase 1